MAQVIERAANQAARAIVKEVEAHTGEPVSLYDAMRLVNVIGCALQRNGLEGGPSGAIRAILEQEVKGHMPTCEICAGPNSDSANGQVCPDCAEFAKTHR